MDKKPKPSPPRKKPDRAPEPGTPDFWPSSELELDEDWEPPKRNRPDSAPWEEEGKLEEAE